jgi:hypothetical protein
MSRREITISWELLLALLQEGTEITHPNGNGVSVCVTGVSAQASVIDVGIAPGRRIVVVVDDPEHDGQGVLNPVWYRR